MKDFHSEFEYAKKVIAEAGGLLKKYANEETLVLEKEGQEKLSDLSTEADGSLEQFIHESLITEYPEYGFIGEEGEASEGEQSWIVDPIDGTMAFSRQIQEFGIALAFKSGNEVIFSVQYIPAFDVLLTAYLNEGSFANDKPLKIGVALDLDHALISVGFQNLWNPIHREHTFSLLDPTHAFRVGHSSVVESYYFASGKTDVLIRFEQKLWDVAPEILLMKEAGGVVTNEFGDELVLTFSKDALHNFMVVNPHMNKTQASSLYKKKT